MPTDKEYLTFCNASNLDWQFVKIEKSEHTEKDKSKKYRYPYLSELLDPKNFIKRNKDGKFAGYVYMPDVKIEGQITSQQKQEGIDEMRSKAGVLMNYREETKEGTSKEGSFLGQWEVIYGGDSYKVVVDYLDNLKKQLKKSYPQIDGEKLVNYPTRKTIENQKDLAQIVRVVSKIADEAITLVLGYGTGQKVLEEAREKLAIAGEMVKESAKDKIVKDSKEVSGKIVKGLYESTLGEFSKASGSTSLIMTNEIRKYWKNEKGALTTTFAINKSQGKNVANSIENFMGDVDLEKISKNFENVEIVTNESLKYYNEKFRVIVLRKGSEIVIASTARKSNSSKNYSQELAYINIVYSLIKKDNSAARYCFTGVDGGGDISFLTSYIDKVIASNSFYCNPSNPTENFIKIQESSLDSSYSLETSFSISLFNSGTVDKISKRNLQILGYNFLLVGLKNQFTLALLKANIYTILVTTIVVVLIELFNYICRSYYNNSIKKQYNYLKEIKCIGSNGYVINDYEDRKIAISLDSNGETVLFDLVAGLFYKFINKKKYGKPSKKIYLSDEIKTDSNEIYILQNLNDHTEWSYTSTYIVLNRIGDIYSLKNILEIEWEIKKDIDTKQLKDNIKKGILKELFNGIISTKINIKSQKKFNLIEKDNIGLEILKVLSIINCLETYKTIQDNFKESKDSLYCTYINEDIVEKKLAIEAKMNKYNGDSSLELNEYVFLPYIQTTDNIGKNIREEYIRNSLRDMVAYFARDSRYKMNLVNDGILKCLKFFANEIEDYEYGGATIKSGIKTKINRSGDFLFSKYLYKKFKGKVGDLQNYYTKTATNDYYQLDFIKEPQMLYGYGENSLTTRSTSPIKVIRGSDTLPAKNFKETIDEMLPPKVENKKKYVAGIVYKYGDVYITDKNRVILAYDLRYQGEDEDNAKKYNKINDLKTVVRSPATGHIHLVEYCNYKRDTYNKMIDNRHKIIIKEIHDKPVEGKKEKVPVSYFHVIELLKPLHPTAKNETSFNIGDFVEVGTEIGYMTKPAKGKENNPKVHYYMMMKSSRNTGSINAALPSNYKKKTENINIVLNPKNYWDEGEEYGSLNYKRTGVDQDYM